MLLKLFSAGEPLLREPAKKLTKAKLLSPGTQNLIDLMIATMRDHPGVGLAAPQVGEPLQIIVAEDKKEHHKKIPAKVLKEQDRTPIPLMVIVNPKIKMLGEDTAYFFEGCMSVNGYRAVVPRVKEVEVTGWDREGKPVKIHAIGWLARILQHEIDHLNGILYTDLMISKSFISDSIFAKKWQGATQIKIQTQWLKK